MWTSSLVTVAHSLFDGIWCCNFENIKLTQLFHILEVRDFLPEGSFGLRVLSLCVCQSVCVSVNHELVCTITHQPFKLGSPNLDQRCKRLWLRSLLFCGAIDRAFKVKLNLKVKIYPILSMWVCLPDKSPPVEISISKFEPKMYLSIVNVPIDFGIDWPWSSFSFSISNLCFSTKFCIYYSVVLVCISLVRPSPVNATHSTGHCTYTDSCMHVDWVLLWTVKQSGFISWWDHRSSMSRWLGDWHWILQAPIGFRQIIHASAQMPQFCMPTFGNHRNNSAH